ncbi:MAG: alpha/beta fold hydrolase, partial [Burkholderiales bacterium]|nr:alpha/beta fold hydrolase [Anaerolineae bacterium]
GGPGASGLASADPYAEAMHESVLENFDIVFFDQRGVGQSAELQCIDAAAAYYQADWNTDTPEQRAEFIEAARTFADDCRAEMNADAVLPYMGTSQAIEDLEAFWRAIADEQMWLYGESYGTQFAQTYAAAYPEHLAGLILDGTVDLTLDSIEFYHQQTQAFSDVLIATLDACNADPLCAADFDGDARAFYDDFTDELETAPIIVDFPLPTGEIVPRPLTLSNFETVVSANLYSETGRAFLLRLMAAASFGDSLPLVREAYVDLALDPVTLEAVYDPTWSDAMFYAVECNDYGFSDATGEEGAQSFIDAGVQASAGIPYLSSIMFGDMPCLFWPGNPPSERPAPLIADGIPTMVLGATLDPATPVGNGEAVYGRLADGYLFTQEGGPHVIYGRGLDCPDDAVTDFLVDGQMPDERENSCEGGVADEYAPVSANHIDDFVDVLDMMWAVDTEIFYLPEYFNWDLESVTSVGCPFGGVLTFEATSIGESLVLDNCAFIDGFILTGTGEFDYNSGMFTMYVQASGAAEGNLTYTASEDNLALTVTGDYAGETIDLVG